MTMYHGGSPAMWPGTVIEPNMGHRKHHDGCPQCEAQRMGINAPGFDPATPHGWVYASEDRDYARYYASLFGKGWVYEVALGEGAERSEEDYFPSWRARTASVVRVVEKRVQLTMDERRKLYRRWGGSDGEFNAMLMKMGINPFGGRV